MKSSCEYLKLYEESAAHAGVGVSLSSVRHLPCHPSSITVLEISKNLCNVLVLHCQGNQARNGHTGYVKLFSVR